MVGSGPKRNFQVFSALDFLAEVTQHIPDKGEHLVRYYGWYSHRQRGIRARAGSAGDDPHIDRSALDTQKSVAHGPRAGSISTWAMLIKRVYEVDPLACPCCGGQMKIVSFIERCQADVIERILRHCGLWEGPLRTLASARAPPHGSPPDPDDPCDLKFVPDPEFPDPEFREAEFREAEFREAQAETSRELQLILDPDFF
jgi:hypothetical protein